MYHEVHVIKGQSRKSGKCAGKVNVLNWGGLLSGGTCCNPNCKIGLREQESAEAIVPSVVGNHREGLNGKCVRSKKFAERALNADCLG